MSADAMTADIEGTLMDDVVLATVDELDYSMAVEYARRIGEEIAPEVLEDMRECGCDFSEGLADGDVRLAIGRVLCKRLGLEA